MSYDYGGLNAAKVSGYAFVKVDSYINEEVVALICLDARILLATRPRLRRAARNFFVALGNFPQDLRISVHFVVLPAGIPLAVRTEFRSKSRRVFLKVIN